MEYDDDWLWWGETDVSELRLLRAYCSSPGRIYGTPQVSLRSWKQFSLFAVSSNGETLSCGWFISLRIDVVLNYAQWSQNFWPVMCSSGRLRDSHLFDYIMFSRLPHLHVCREGPSATSAIFFTGQNVLRPTVLRWDFRFSRRRVWSLESSGM
jgi:hypothetical protein